MTFEDVVSECLKIDELVAQFNRLTGCQLLIDQRKPIEKMIDKATGHDKELEKKQREYLYKFIGFVFEYIFLPISLEANK